MAEGVEEEKKVEGVEVVMKGKVEVMEVEM